MVANVALALEYQATCQLAEHRLAAWLELDQVGIFIDAVLAMVEPVETHFLWRPQLSDPADEFARGGCSMAKRRQSLNLTVLLVFADAVPRSDCRHGGCVPPRRL
jgi:hypothetical protein